MSGYICKECGRRNEHLNINILGVCDKQCFAYRWDRLASIGRYQRLKWLFDGKKNIPEWAWNEHQENIKKYGKKKMKEFEKKYMEWITSDKEERSVKYREYVDTINKEL